MHVKTCSEKLYGVNMTVLGRTLGEICWKIESQIRLVLLRKFLMTAACEVPTAVRQNVFLTKTVRKYIQTYLVLLPSTLMSVHLHEPVYPKSG